MSAERDPDGVVVAGAAGGTVFSLLVVAAATGRLTVVPCGLIVFILGKYR